MNGGYHFTREYDTHVETWVILESDPPTDAMQKAYDKLGVQAQVGGQWYTVWHDFHHTQEAADKHRAEYVKDAHAFGNVMEEVRL